VSFVEKEVKWRWSKLCSAYPDLSVKPSYLVSFWFVPPYMKKDPSITLSEFYDLEALDGDFVLDSGAYSAANKGKSIDIYAYADYCQAAMQYESRLSEIFTLDVPPYGPTAGDWKTTQKNTEFLWKRNIPAIPVYHVGEPVEVLKDMASSYPKISLGGAVGMLDKLTWAERCFAEVWPKRIHGLGFSGKKAMLRLPFETLDSSTMSMAIKFARLSGGFTRQKKFRMNSTPTGYVTPGKFISSELANHTKKIDSYAWRADIATSGMKSRIDSEIQARKKWESLWEKLKTQHLSAQ